MPETYILQQLDELRKRLEGLSGRVEEHQRESREEMKKMENRMQLLEQSHSVSEDMK
ncbi:MAG: hypothetical protein IJX77_07865 [Ruminococcus sp.]|nr:hypothetical protein [Ruminococcus sp.]